MEQLPNGFTLNLPEGAFPLSTDSMVLSHLSGSPKTPGCWISAPAAAHWGCCCAP